MNSGSLLLLREHEKHGFDQLPRFAAGVVAQPKEHCAALTTFGAGEAYTERRSRRGGTDLSWLDESAPGTGAEAPQDAKNARPLNLDVVLRFTLPIWNPLLISCEPLGDRDTGDQQNLVLYPADLRHGLTVWVKNRELDAILLDSDLEPDPYDSDCPHRDDLDHDHALLALIAERPELLTIPRRVGGDASDCGSGCGCTGDPYP
jgi:hypothetical protein